MLFKADFFGERALLTEEPRWVLYNLAREIVQLSKDIESAVTLNSDSIQNLPYPPDLQATLPLFMPIIASSQFGSILVVAQLCQFRTGHSIRI